MIRSRHLVRGWARLWDRFTGAPDILDPSRQTREDFLTTLHEKFSEDGVVSLSLGAHWWDDFFDAITSRDEDGLEVQERMTRHIEELDHDTMTSGEWVRVYKLALKFGLFKVGYALRLNARNVAIHALSENLLSSTSRDYLRALSALLEVQNWEMFEQKLPLLDTSLKQERTSLELLYCLLKDGSASRSAQSALIQSEDDLAYSKYISGKRVALVGPAKTESRDAQEIDAFDLVIRFNYKEIGVGTDPDIKGLLCDVSYYNSAQAKYIYKTKPVETFPRSVDWLVCKHRSRSIRLRKWLQTLPRSTSDSGDSEGAKVRPSSTFEIPLFAGTLNAVPNAVLDLLGLDVGAIEIFHSDLMLTVDRATNYDPLVRNTEDALFMAVKTFAGTHDPVTQYALLKTLYDSGAIAGDDKFSLAMSLGEETYMAELQKAYGNSARKCVR